MKRLTQQIRNVIQEFLEGRSTSASASPYTRVLYWEVVARLSCWFCFDSRVTSTHEKKIRLIWSQRYGNAKISHWRDEDISLWIELVDVCCISMFACFSFFISCVLMLLSFFFTEKTCFCEYNTVGFSLFLPLNLIYHEHIKMRWVKKKKHKMITRFCQRFNVSNHYKIRTFDEYEFLLNETV